ncbi:uncharacterized protein K460DRAFT_97699 [Cucurbitaria berberidis CBS 394.84]|uniref:Uncharacterized protein n=1 Tax=Cucurbitaria berberidis CBS 394.84 TaxID=1168544 RepID=A0A9P4GGD2_9PLEO|nr:uncharacterized protein K460DRAFT_97699 [Cucurbitaria berberidis CBS 394.84]KAF1844734.1 hypothetical protein K460DRAFT_97699 [Cucurbitaria berberidis CBS 394.84]
MSRSAGRLMRRNSMLVVDAAAASSEATFSCLADALAAGDWVDTTAVSPACANQPRCLVSDMSLICVSDMRLIPRPVALSTHWPACDCISPPSRLGNGMRSEHAWESVARRLWAPVCEHHPSCSRYNACKLPCPPASCSRWWPYSTEK